MRSQPADFLASRGLPPGGALFVGKAGQFGNIDIAYPDPYVAFIIKAPEENDGAPIPRLVGVAGELYTEVFADPPADTIYVGYVQHIGGAFMATAVSGPDDTAGPLVYTPYFSSFAPAMFPVGLPLAAASTLPAMNMCPLGEFEPEVSRGNYVFLVATWDQAVPPPAGETVIGGTRIYKLLTDELGVPGAEELVQPAYPVGALPGFVNYVAPLGPGRAIYLQAFNNGSTVEDSPATSPVEPEIRRVEGFDSVEVSGVLSDIDSAVAGVPSLWTDIEYRAAFAKVGPTHIMFTYGRRVGATAVNLFLSDDDGASWAVVALPVWPLSDPQLFFNTVWSRSPVECFGAGCVSIAVDFESHTKTGFFYTLDYGVSWAELPLTGIPGWPGLGDFTPISVSYSLIVLRPYVSENDKGELAVLYADPDDLDHPRSLYVTTDLGAKWSWRSAVSWAEMVVDSGGWGNAGEFVGSTLRPAPIITGLPTAMEPA